jgi:hypothetical protein
MVLIATTLVLGLCQAPQTPAPETRTPSQKDVIILKAGERIIGRIVKETADYIEVRMGAGSVVGFGKSRVLRITRAGVAESGPVAKPLLANRDSWFLLHNGLGETVGHLHSSVATTDDGGFRIGEEWRFKRKGGTTDITLVEVLDNRLHPRSCLYHERSFEKQGGRLTTERLVHGVVDGERFVVQRRTLSGQERISYRLRERMKFPLSLLEELRQRPRLSKQSARYSLFDPRIDEFVGCNVSTRARRTVEWQGRQVQVREIATETSRGSNVEWLNASSDTIRREINGQALVAVRTTEAVARGHRVSTHAGVTSALVANHDKGLALWLPNPVWRPLPNTASQVRIEAPIYRATAVLTELDQMDAGLELDSAADAVLRWLRLSLGADLKVIRRGPMPLRGRPSILIDASYRVAKPGKVEFFRAQVHVFRIGNRYLALCCTAPRQFHKELEADYQRIRRSVELTRDDFAPEPQGPLKKN